MELDAVVGPNRLPTFEDRDSLPYVECVVQEVLRYLFFSFVLPLDIRAYSLLPRWFPTVPLGKPMPRLE